MDTEDTRHDEGAVQTIERLAREADELRLRLKQKSTEVNELRTERALLEADLRTANNRIDTLLLTVENLSKRR